MYRPENTIRAHVPTSQLRGYVPLRGTDPSTSQSKYSTADNNVHVVCMAGINFFAYQSRRYSARRSKEDGR
jgi:hypothetical protein